MKFVKWFLVLTVTVTLLCCSHVCLAEDAGDPLVSPALAVLAEQSPMAKAGLVGAEVEFEAEDFERALNVSAISSITVTSLPERADGILYFGGNEVTVGQTISRANIPYMTFSFMNEEITDSAFRFSTNHGAYDMECAVYCLEYENRPPVVSSVAEAVASVSTYKNISVFGRMDAYDPDGDELTFQVISYPKSGLLIADSDEGAYQYIPVNGFTGADSFRYVAVDQYGNYSKPLQVTLNVTQPKTTLVYSDLMERESHVAAIAMTERGIMASSELNGTYYFYPDEEVTRAEFLVMAMKTMGIRSTLSDEATVFADDSEIPSEFRGYVAEAQKLGYVCGRLNEENALVFCPNDKITRYEAAVMLYKLKEMELPVIKPLFADADTVPVWARDAVYSMTAAGILTDEKGYIDANATVTREEAAQMLYRFGVTQD